MFVFQFDALIELLTGREMLTMYARLRGVPDEKIKGIVSDIIHLLRLEKWADSLCGNYRYTLGLSFFCFVLGLNYVENSFSGKEPS